MPRAEFFTLFGLFVQRDFFSKKECAQIRSQMCVAAGGLATIRRKEDIYVVDESVRRVRWLDVPATTMSSVENRLRDLKPAIEKHFGLTLTGFQSPQFLDYRVGDFYGPHRDSSADPGAGKMAQERQVSVVIFANSESAEPHDDAYCGGALTFFGLMNDPRGAGAGMPLVGEEGLLIAFRSPTMHSVTPVTYGQRYTIVTWFY